MAIARQLKQVLMSEIKTDKNQPRKHFDKKALDELAASIKQHGVLQPVLLRKDDKAQTILVAGERRFKAAQKSKLEAIPAIFVEGKDSAEISLVENLLREDLTAVEEAEAIQRLKDEHDYALEDLSKIIGKAVSTLSEVLSISKLPIEIRNKCRKDPSVSRRKLVEIAKKPTEKGMLSLFNKMEEKGLSRDELRERKGSKHRSSDKVIASSVGSLIKALGRFKDGKLNATQKKNVSGQLTSLRDEIDEILKALDG